MWDDEPVPGTDAGPGRRLVTYHGMDDGSEASLEALVEAIATDARERARRGWRMASTSVVPMRQAGTAGNILLQSGGQFATRLSAVVLYVQDPA